MTEQCPRPDMGAVKHTRRMPPEWQELSEFAHDQLAAQADPRVPEVDTILAVREAVDGLENDDLEKNRYYGLGNVVCNVYRKLADPNTRETVVREAGAELADYYRRDNLVPKNGEIPPFRADDLVIYPMHGAFLPVTRAASNALQSPVRLLTDTLTQAEKERQRLLEYPHLADSGSEEAASLMDFGVRCIRQNKPAAEAVAREVLTGTLITLERAVKAKSLAANPDVLNLDVVNPVVTPEVIRATDIGPLAPRFAALRLDEFPAGGDDTIHPYIEVEPTGTLRFKRELVGPEPTPVDDGIHSGPVLHSSRLGCPALNVPGMIPLVRELVPDILDAARQQLAS